MKIINGDFIVHDVPIAENTIRIVRVSVIVVRSCYTDIAGFKLYGT